MINLRPIGTFERDWWTDAERVFQCGRLRVFQYNADRSQYGKRCATSVEHVSFRDLVLLLVRG